MGIRAVLHKDDVGLKIKMKHFRGSQTVKYIKIYNASNNLIGFARTQPLSAENITFMKLKWFRYTIKHCLPGPAPGFLLGPGHYISTTVLLCLQNQINPQINDFCSKNCWTIFSFEYKLSKGIFTEIQFSWIESRQTFFRYVSDNVSRQIFCVLKKASNPAGFWRWKPTIKNANINEKVSNYQL